MQDAVIALQVHALLRNAARKYCSSKSCGDICVQDKECAWLEAVKRAAKLIELLS